MAEEEKQEEQTVSSDTPSNASAESSADASTENEKKDESSSVSNDTINMKLEPDEPESNNPTLKELQKKSEHISRMTDKALINEKSGASVSVRENGQINLSAGMYAQYKLNPSGKSIEHSMESITMTNRKRILADEIVVNEHKLNPRLYEFTDFKKVELTTNQEALVGNFCVYGSVLVKAWEADLKRYVMIRRPARMPMFSPLLNLPKIMPELGITDPLEFEEDILAKSDKGYQVNALISDAKSLIGKEGVDRPGIDRQHKIVIGSISGISSSGGGTTSAGSGSSNANGAAFSGDGDLKIKDVLQLDTSKMTDQSGVADLVIHHTGNGTDEDTDAETINKMHLANGWAGIGYHFVVRKDGSIERGRPENKIGSHCQGHNTGSLGIHLSGDYETGSSNPPQAQLDATVNLIAHLCKKYKLEANRTTVRGHREFCDTACPGKHLYPLLDKLASDAKSKMS